MAVAEKSNTYLETDLITTDRVYSLSADAVVRSLVDIYFLCHVLQWTQSHYVSWIISCAMVAYCSQSFRDITGSLLEVLCKPL